MVGVEPDRHWLLFQEVFCHDEYIIFSIPLKPLFKDPLWHGIPDRHVFYVIFRIADLIDIAADIAQYAVHERLKA